MGGCVAIYDLNVRLLEEAPARPPSLRLTIQCIRQPDRDNNRSWTQEGEGEDKLNESLEPKDTRLLAASLVSFICLHLNLLTTSNSSTQPSIADLLHLYQETLMVRRSKMEAVPVEERSGKIFGTSGIQGGGWGAGERYTCTAGEAFGEASDCRLGDDGHGTRRGGEGSGE
ncbi:hypothetical protein HPP92_028796 [Vanilla planifolia]|uniref:Uncharacterized protein n=1 Tax=Vanilla planifolia TaxID=51239 RepID=A0A835P6Q1_VANPL|nr:hypothetical protein HPP92_028796 [Vanilla planifolia]KAG0446527.1 hypothetical protein HPP92_028785 [Vanilla planifolia]